MYIYIMCAYVIKRFKKHVNTASNAWPSRYHAPSDSKDESLKTPCSLESKLAYRRNPPVFTSGLCVPQEKWIETKTPQWHDSDMFLSLPCAWVRAKSLWPLWGVLPFGDSVVRAEKMLISRMIINLSSLGGTLCSNICHGKWRWFG